MDRVEAAAPAHDLNLGDLLPIFLGLVSSKWFKSAACSYVFSARRAKRGRGLRTNVLSSHQSKASTAVGAMQVARRAIIARVGAARLMSTAGEMPRQVSHI